MMGLNKTAIGIRRCYMNQAVDGTEGGAAGGDPTQDVESRLESILFPGNDDASADDNAVLDDGQLVLPENNDAEAEHDAEVDGGQDDQEIDDVDDQTLASVLGLEDDKLAFNEDGDVVFNAIIDGEATPVSINDLVKSYQLEGHVNNKSIALENDRKEFTQTRDKAYDELVNRLETANKLLELSQQSLVAEYQGIDWDGLRMTDPAEWAALRQQYAERLQSIDQAKSQVGQNKTGLTEEQQNEQAQKQQEFINGEIQKMIVDNPSWSDQNVMADEVGKIGQFLQSQYGFTPEEIANNMDSRLMKLIQDAQRLHSGKASVKDKKIPKNVPKFRKPGANQASRKSVNAAAKAKAQKKAIRQSGGSVDAIAASLIDRM